MQDTMAVVIPTYGAFPYAARAVRSALKNTLTQARVIVVDDGSPGFYKDNPVLGLLTEFKGRVSLFRFPHNGGLTRVWNKGLALARDLGCTYACCGNSDLVFPHGWDQALVDVLSTEIANLVGPLTNAPGTQELQDVQRYLADYTLTDEDEALDRTCTSLRQANGSQFLPAVVNGFCMVAKTDTWWKHAHVSGNVFRPRNDYDSRGRRNPTPLMTLNEYELQHRWLTGGLVTGFCTGSFVFHYRAVSRGERHKKGNWYRMR